MHFFLGTLRVNCICVLSLVKSYLAVLPNKLYARVHQPLKHSINHFSPFFLHDRAKLLDPGLDYRAPAQGGRFQVDHTTSAHSSRLKQEIEVSFEERTSAHTGKSMKHSRTFQYRHSFEKIIRPRGYKTFIMLNSTEHKISTAHKN